MPFYTKTPTHFNSRGGRAFGQRYQTATAPTFSNGTWHLSVRANAPFWGVRLWIRNNETTAFTIGSAAACASTSDLLPNTVGGTWTVGGFSNTIVPARLGVNRVSHVVSDIIPCTSVLASDGSGKYIAMVRIYVALAPLSVNFDAGVFSAWDSTVANPKVLNMYANAAIANGDFVSANQTNFAGYTSPVDLMSIMDVEFMHTVPVMNVVTLSDSIGWGAGGSVLQCGYMFLACQELSTSTMPIYWQNEGVPGSTTSMCVTRLLDMLAAGFRPQILHYPAFSPNDGVPSQIILTTQMGNLSKVLDICKDYNIIPIIDTGICNTLQAWDATADGYRKQACSYVRSLASPNVFVLDADASGVSDNAAAARFVPAATTDNTHPNDYGGSLIKVPAKNVVRQIQSIIFNGQRNY